jgi:hypothetical protein
MPSISKSLAQGLNNTNTGAPIQTHFLKTNLAPGSQYNAQTISSLVFGIFMALLAIYAAFRHFRFRQDAFKSFSNLFS